MNSFEVVAEFERRVAEYAGAKHGIAVNTCTSAIFLSLLYRFQESPHAYPRVTLPARTFISVPMAVVQAGGFLEFHNAKWQGTYPLEPWDIVDGALRFRAACTRRARCTACRSTPGSS